jgi:hypothetical protein
VERQVEDEVLAVIDGDRAEKFDVRSLKSEV